MYHVKKEGLKGMSADSRADFERIKEYMKPGGEHMQEQQARAERLEGMTYREKVEDRKKEEEAQGFLKSKISKLYGNN
ncbi:hypothetical protein N8654_01930 [Synechococcus sp. AH-601-B19]|nr:hypothetical protein [Synechococcus sp. AH-601-B19]